MNLTPKHKTPSQNLPWASFVLQVIALVVLFLAVDYAYKYRQYLISKIISLKQNSHAKPRLNNQTKTDSHTPKPVLAIASWNLNNMGSSKSNSEIAQIAHIINNYDLVAIQEVSVKNAGAQAIATLNDQLNRLGNKWQYALSNPTSGKGTERYAYLWKSNKTTLYKNVHLVTQNQLGLHLEREPAIAYFNANGKQLAIANFHAVPLSKNPQNEIVLLCQLHQIYANENLIIAGDFNLSENNNAFEPLKNEGYLAVLHNQKTSLNRIVDTKGNYLSQEYDNIFVEKTAFSVLQSGIFDFVPSSKNLKSARQLADHLPVWCQITIR